MQLFRPAASCSLNIRRSPHRMSCSPVTLFPSMGVDPSGGSLIFPEHLFGSGHAMDTATNPVAVSVCRSLQPACIPSVPLSEARPTITPLIFIIILLITQCDFISRREFPVRADFPAMEERRLPLHVRNQGSPPVESNGETRTVFLNFQLKMINNDSIPKCS